MLFYVYYSLFVKVWKSGSTACNLYCLPQLKIEHYKCSVLLFQAHLNFHLIFLSFILSFLLFHISFLFLFSSSSSPYQNPRIWPIFSLLISSSQLIWFWLSMNMVVILFIQFLSVRIQSRQFHDGQLLGCGSRHLVVKCCSVSRGHDQDWCPHLV